MNQKEKFGQKQEKLNHTPTYFFLKETERYQGKRGAFHSFENAYYIFSEQKDLYGFLMDFSSKQKDFCQKCTKFFGSEIPLEGKNLLLEWEYKGQKRSLFTFPMKKL